jgi:LDH2 family malate/lactate/ureidoglycolate dehydrogenase
MPRSVSADELTDLAVRVLRRRGVSGENAGPAAKTVVAAEREGIAVSDDQWARLLELLA